MQLSPIDRSAILKDAEELKEQALPQYRNMIDLWSLCSVGRKLLREGKDREVHTFKRALVAFDMAWEIWVTSTTPSVHEDNPTSEFDDFMALGAIAAAGQQEAQSKMYGFSQEDFGETKPLKTKQSVFYLRSFITDRRHFLPNNFNIHSGDVLPYPREPEELTLEASLMRVFASYCLCFALGGVPDPFGMGRIMGLTRGERPVDDTEWKKRVAAFVRFSNVIFILPSDTDGVRWELEHIKTSGNAAKIILIALPETVVEDGSARWRIFFKITEKLGYKLPKYRRQGVFLRLNSDGGVQESLAFEALWNTHLFHLVERMFADQTSV